MPGSEVTGSVLSGADPLENTISLFLVQVVVIMATTRLLAVALAYLKQPKVIAEVLAGIVLGPSVLGYIPGYMETLWPTESLPFLNLFANIGLLLYMFLTGLELNPGDLLRNAKNTVAISATGIIFPFCLGALASFVLYAHQHDINAEHKPPFTSFLLFTGTSMSITAFPVLARILTDLNLVETDVGLLSIGSAVINDAVAWCMLILIISILNSADTITALYVFFLVAGYGVLLLVVIRPFINKYLEKASSIDSENLQSSVLAITFMAIFISSFFTEIAGVHTIFGAFLLGLAVPSRNPTALRLAKTIEDFSSIVLLPLYFAASGLRAQISSITSLDSVWMLLMVLVVSTVGKFFGCGLAARAAGVPWRESLTIGALMNTRGLVELIVLNLGLDAKVINIELFTIFVLMALLTTFATSPIVSYIYPPHLRAKNIIPSLASDAPSASAKMEFAGTRLMVTAQRMHDVPGLALLVQLIRPDVVSAVRFVESDETPFSIIMAHGRHMAVEMDPTLQMMNTCGYLSGLPVETHLKVCSRELFAGELCKRASDEHADMILMPCRRNNDDVPFLRDYHGQFVSQVIDRCQRTLLLFWDHNLGPQITTTHPRDITRRRVVVLFQGGPNDREVLRLAKRFAQQDLLVDVFVVQKSRVTTLQDLEAMACFEASVASKAAAHISSPVGSKSPLGSKSPMSVKDGGGLQSTHTHAFASHAQPHACPANATPRPHKHSSHGNVMVHRVNEQVFVDGVMEFCKAHSPHLILCGASEGYGSLDPTEKRSSVLNGAEMNFSKLKLLGKLGEGLTATHEIQASVLIVLCPTTTTTGIAVNRMMSGLGPLGIIVNEEGGQYTGHSDDDTEELKMAPSLKEALKEGSAVGITS